jgi:kynurenine 3-monooxygenase
VEIRSSAWRIIRIIFTAENAEERREDPLDQLFSAFLCVLCGEYLLKQSKTVMDEPDFTIVGCGLAGTLMARYLAREGHRVDLYEKRADPRLHEQDRGRSINLALSIRGIHALGEVGLADEVVRSSILMRGRMIHAVSGGLTFQPYGKDDSEALHSVSRAGLNRLLVEAAARYPSVGLFFGKKCTDVDVQTGLLEFADDVNSSLQVRARCVIGADGAFSAVRAALQKLERFNYHQDFLTHGYKELTIPPGPDGTHRMEEHALHIWPRGSFMMIALPNTDGSFTCTLFWHFEGPNSFAALTSESAVNEYFRDQFPDAVPLLPDLAHEFLLNPTGSLVTIRCQPWHAGGRVVLLGDACHAVVPFLGQGMNAAFEDCTVLCRCLAEHGKDLETAFRAYETARKEHTDTLADLCIDNFLEMRDRVGSRYFIVKKKAAVLLHKLFPRWYLPLYTMIEFTRIPYADALRRARRQDRAVGVIVVLLVLLLVSAAVLLLR